VKKLKKIDKRTQGQLLVHYPNIDWKKIIALRNIIAHEYFYIDAEEIFDTVQNVVLPLLTTIQQIIADLERNTV